MALDSMDQDDNLRDHIKGATNSKWIKKARTYLLKKQLIEIY